MPEIEAPKLHDAFSASEEHMHRVQDEFSIRLDGIQQLRSALAQNA
jgi:hypothetical protein